MSGRRRRVTWACIIAVIVVAAGVLYFIRRSPRTPWNVPFGQANDLQGILAKANYFYWLHNLPKSTPLYQRAEELATQAHDSSDGEVPADIIGAKGNAISC